MQPITIPTEIFVVLGQPDAFAVRNEHGEVTEIRGGRSAVTAAAIMRMLAPSVAPAFETRECNRHSSYRRNSLYGIDVNSRLAVVLERDGTWDNRKSYGTSSKEYVLIDLRTGKRRTVTHGKVRGEIRTDGDLPAAGVAGAVSGKLGITKLAARKAMAIGHRFPVFEDARPQQPSIADIPRVVSPMRLAAEQREAARAAA